MSVPTFEQFSRAIAGTPMAREARAIYDTAIKGGINPALVVGIAGAESNFGRLGYAVGRNNPFGLMGFRFPSYAAATQKLVQTLNSQGLGYKKAYQGAGGGARGLNAMINIYTPRGAANGPNNDPDGHTRNIISIGRKTGGDPAQAYINPGSVPLPGAGAAGAAGATPSSTAGAPDYSKLMALFRQQREAMSRGEGYNRDIGKQLRDSVIEMVGSGNVGGGAVKPNQMPGGADAPIPASGDQPRLSKWGGPSEHGSRALGDWQSDLAWDLGGKAGTPVRAPLGGKVVKISGAPGTPRGPQFAGYGVTIDFGGGRQAFFKHLGSLGPGVRPGATVAPGTLIGGLEAGTGGGPHLHLGANSSGFLQQILSYYAR